MKGNIYVVDINPRSADFHKVVRTISLPWFQTEDGLRQIAISKDGHKLYVTAPNRKTFEPTSANESYIFVINIDPADRPENPLINPRFYWEIIKTVSVLPNNLSDPMPQELWGIQATDDPNVLVFTNRSSDSSGFGILTVTSQDPTSFSASMKHVGLNLGPASDSFDVNNGIAALILPENALAATIGAHPAYALVAGSNKFVQGVPSSDPDAFTKSSGSKVPAGSNVGLIRDPFGSPELVAATSGVPIGVLDNSST
jgi:hypothetical protein